MIIERPLSVTLTSIKDELLISSLIKSGMLGKGRKLLKKGTSALMDRIDVKKNKKNTVHRVDGLRHLLIFIYLQGAGKGAVTEKVGSTC